METLISVPIAIGRDRSLHVEQKQKGSTGLFGILSSIASGSQLSGTIHIQHVPADAAGAVEVCADRVVGHDVKDDTTGTSQSIVVTTDAKEPVDIFIRIPTSEKGGFDKLHVQAANYRIKSEIETPSAPPEKNAHLSPADVDFVPARDLHLSSQSGSISGLCPIDEALTVTTGSGTIGVQLLPLVRPEARGATVKFTSGSGSIGINKSLDASLRASRMHFPSRDSSVSVTSNSGSVSAILGLTKSLAFTSNSGSHKITALLTDHSRDRRSDLTTSTNSGSHSITVVDAAEESASATKGGADDRGFVCKHKANSGGVRLAYPASWQGTVEAIAGSGSISISGEGVEVDKVNKRVTGVRGNGEHHTEVTTNSGSISVKYN